MKHYDTVLSIAGSDSSGGAGIQADIKTCTALGVYAMTAITALTAQNTMGVSSFEASSEALLRAQLQAVIEDIRPDAVKTGMIPTAAHIHLIADFIRKYDLKNLVVDPVMVATSGDSLCNDDTKEAFLAYLMPHARIVTPNIPEAEALTDIKITDRSSMQIVALDLLIRTGCGAVLLKGGHGNEEDRHADLLMLGYKELTGETRHSHFAEPIWLEHKHIDTPNTHGTGCTLSSAIASFLAKGLNAEQAVRKAVDWLSGAIASGADYSIGHGHGPVNHLYKITYGN
ncbi:MAG: bifunctional hydroxymethylpyrimidine kinase/phosphomethylpyrimidine kinase [Prevotella sp.]|nr:bifunctional hydroxymethylpyrimidine kinase/phosphomethylpyrimidine kinase [Prevotella sp.]MCM1075493.1 bifunctional hydroxymethylpyrimidine kinase/phosphomethylpyrimidine kinase [Ruminococcus sp.]